MSREQAAEAQRARRQGRRRRGRRQPHGASSIAAASAAASRQASRVVAFAPKSIIDSPSGDPPRWPNDERGRSPGLFGDPPLQPLTTTALCNGHASQWAPPLTGLLACRCAERASRHRSNCTLAAHTVLATSRRVHAKSAAACARGRPSMSYRPKIGPATGPGSAKHAQVNQ